MLPNFLVVGAAKCGTTSLFHYLNQHPQIFIPDKKECYFFSDLPLFTGPRNDQEINKAAIHSVAEYKVLFAPAEQSSLRGDVSHDYLYYHQRSIPNILKHLGSSIPIVIILRDPRARAFSHYKHHVKAGTTRDASFAQALAREQSRIEQGWSWNWHYVRVGLYAEQVEAFRRAFRRVRIYLFDDLCDDEAELIRDLYGFLGADTGFQPETRIENPGVSIRHSGLNRFLTNESYAKDIVKGLMRSVGLTREQISRLKHRTITINTGAKETLDDAHRSQLTALFEEDLSRLEHLIGRDLAAWRR